jgi:hypothetical protein
MMGTVNIDYSELQDYVKHLEKVDLESFCRDCAKELAARLLAKAIKRTPVGVYPASSGKHGGTLRRGWTAGQNAISYAHALPVSHVGDSYTIEIINPVEYAPYVEYGHRTRNGSWVEGRFMLTISEQEIQGKARSILQNKITKKLKEVFSE